MTKLVQAPILIDQATAAAVRKRIPAATARVRTVARVRPYGTEGHVEISELLPPADEPGQLSDEQIRQYEEAVVQFTTGQWSEALESLHAVPARDRVKDFLTVFIAQHGRTPPAGWDGVIPLSSKG